MPSEAAMSVGAACLHENNFRFVRAARGEGNELTWHHIPKHSSWLNMAEIEIFVPIKQ